MFFGDQGGIGPGVLLLGLGHGHGYRGQLLLLLLLLDGVAAVQGHHVLGESTALDIVVIELDELHEGVFCIVLAFQHEIGEPAVSVEFRPVGLLEIAGDDEHAFFAEPGGEHQHLGGGTVLHFVGDDETTVECPAAHEGQRCHFELSFFQHVGDLGGGEVMVQQIDDGSCPGIHFGDDVAREEAHFFFDGDHGTGDDEFVDAFGAQGFNGGFDSHGGFAGSSGTGADGQGDLGLSQGAEVVVLVDGLGGESWPDDGFGFSC